MSDDATNTITSALIDSADKVAALHSDQHGSRAKLPGQPAARSVRQRLFTDAPSFDFFQAVCLLEACAPDKHPVGLDNLPDLEAIRFRVLPTNSFPASTIYEIATPDLKSNQAEMTVTFFGMIGINGALPRQYTDSLIASLREGKGPEKRALLDWFDMYHHRLLSLFHRAWAKYRFPIAYARREFEDEEPDTFTQAMYSLIGQGMPSLRDRLNVRVRSQIEQRSATTLGESSLFETQLLSKPVAAEASVKPQKTLAEVTDLALLRYAGLLTQRPRCVANLQRLISDYFRLPVEVKQFQGQWLGLSERNQTQLGARIGASLGHDAVAGERIWSVESKIRLRLGPLSYEQFSDLLPDTSPAPQRKAFFLLHHLVRLFVGPELDFEVQLILHADDVPQAQISTNPEEGPRLGWNCWLHSEPTSRNAEDAIFDAEVLPDNNHAIAI